MRKSQPYAIEKLYYVERYQQIFAKGMKKAWRGNLGYVDLLAGSGRCWIETTNEEFEGSPVRSLKAPFAHRIFVEENLLLADALSRRIGNVGRVIRGDCNAPSVIAEIRAAIPDNALTLTFVDNLGTDVALETLRALTQQRKMDLLVVMQVQDFTRNVLTVLDGDQDRTRIDAFFGGRAWEDVVNLAIRQNASPAQISDNLVDHYAGCLRGLGRPEIALGRRTMRNSNNAAQYRLLLASADPRAVDFFRKIEQIDPHGQRGLFG
jgi:three-Cys-motif partner protein